MPKSELDYSPLVSKSERERAKPKKQSRTSLKIDELWDQLGKGSGRKEFASDQLDALESLRMDQLQKVKMMDESLQKHETKSIPCQMAWGTRSTKSEPEP